MKRITILVADDEAEIADLIALHLEKEGYQIIKVPDGKEALRVIQTQPIDLAILDIMMPKMDGYEVTRLIREQYHMPIIFLSAKTSDMDKITGLVMGADDYMIKPFNPMELVARVNAQLRRYMQLNRHSTDNEAVLESGGLSIYPDQRKVVLYGEVIELTPKEFDILHLLASHPKKVFSADHIFQQVWGEAYYESGNNTVMVHIRTLRKKIGDDTNKHKLIKTVWGVGYTFNP
ncbi:response regulator transcription factor [Paenibacillus vulneris]|uniref:Response regulator transcription factor n=1 Tax=Paenibacillus vulneris TaxID=1133364 RepID=A0ABW3UNE0_9BACL|nr:MULTISPECIES: response regulator transcription factor [unclassified Paenibacillus]MBE1444430.1 DNA-binding response OmpR family regulator [Paenibacillus sp. OAS669]